MAKFMGTVQGQRGEAHRLGHSSIEVVAASWHGAVSTEMYEERGEIWVRISTIPRQGRGKFNLVYEGPLEPMFAADTTRPLYAAKEPA